MTTDTKLKELVINKLTTAQYDAIEEKDPNQLYIVTDAPPPGIPDYSAGVTYSSDFVAPTSGYCLSTNHVAAWGTAKLLADGVVIDQQHNNTSGTNILIYTRGFCKKGQTISKDGVSAWDNVIFYPCLGG